LDSEGRIRDLSSEIEDISGPLLGAGILQKLRAIDPVRLPQAKPGVRLGACVSGVGKIVGVGLNYRTHALEAALEPPPEPLLFLKAPSALSGPYDGIVIPKGAQSVDWEVELAVVIGRRASYVDEVEALDCIAGYAVINDVSERDFQLKRQGQWSKGKSADTFAPLGPWLLTTDEVPDPQRLDLWLDVNGVRRQSASTGQMIFGVGALISYTSQFMTLLPGDVLATGTPSGIGGAMTPPMYLAPGDEVTFGVAGLGEQRHRVRSYADASAT